MYAYSMISKNIHGRYGLDNGQYFTTGDDIEVRIGVQWVKTRVHHNHTDYYLVDFPELPMEGLTAKYRNCSGQKLDVL